MKYFFCLYKTHPVDELEILKSTRNQHFNFFLQIFPLSVQTTNEVRF